MTTVKIKRLDNFSGELPRYATEGSSGMDVCSAINFWLAPGQREAIPTGLAFEIPEFFEIQVRPRSGLALKHGITVVNAPGTVDSDYRGELKVILANIGHNSFEIKKGDRIAQLVCARVEPIYWEEINYLENTVRGAGGFGSTGLTFEKAE